MEIGQFINNCEEKCHELFVKIDEVALINQKKVLDAFHSCKISLNHFCGTSGYGYGDYGREKLNILYSKVFNCEKALVSPHICSGTHAISLCLSGILRPNDILLSISGKPYDTLDEIIYGEGNGSLKDFGIKYKQIDFLDGDFDYKQIENNICQQKVKMIFIQRSRGYKWIKALSMQQINSACQFIKTISPDTIIMIDNCYGEFVDIIEPTDNGCDIIAGSLIKNPGGGLAPTGGYICGKKSYIDLIAGRLTAPGIGDEIGSYSEGYRLFFQGLFMAPHTVAQTLKGSALMRRIFYELGYKVLPEPNDKNNDIITSVIFDNEDDLIAFHQSIQSSSPIDSFLTLYPWDMPGYNDKVIMAAGTFVQGASIELSSDSPIKMPYTAYIQGGLTYEHVKLTIIDYLEKMKIKT